MQEQTARANQQVEVVSAKLSIDIAADRAEAARRVAEGVRDSTRTRAEGDAEAVRQVGRATADAYSAQAAVIGSERLAMLKVVDEVSSGKVKITPDVMVNGGGDGGSGGGLFNAWLATALRPIPEQPNGVSVPGDPGAAPLVNEGSEDDQGKDG